MSMKPQATAASETTQSPSASAHDAGAAAPSRLHNSRWMRGLLWSCGVLSLILGAIGVVLPGLPTTPFILLAAACFVRTSPRAHAWLLRNRLFGPMLIEWETHRTISRRVKHRALATMAVSVSISLWLFASSRSAQIVMVVGALIGAVWVCRIPSRDEV